MIAAQRRVHRVVWTFVAPVLAALAVLLLFARPPSPASTGTGAPGAQTGAPE